MLHRHAIGVDPLCPGSSVPPFYIPASSNASTESILDHGLKLAVGSGPEALADPRNADVLAWVGDRLLPRELAKVSAFDSAVQGGDAVWEGLRVYDGRVFKLEEHIQRLVDSAKAMAFKNVPSREFIRKAVFRTLAANGMRDSVHMRLTLTRGAKITSSMNPVFNIFGTNLIILPEWKPVGDMATYDNSSGISLITATNRRNSPQCVDSKIHHCNLINNSKYSTYYTLTYIFVWMVLLCVL
jgi:branched-subunit amino acid aminotransferase/4-amino-4-deoxychorismate lyase